MSAFANLFRAGPAAILILIAMVAGSVLLWIGVPTGWLWIGSQVQASTKSVGTALGVALVGAAISIGLIALGLGWLNRRYGDIAEQRGIDPGDTSILEYVLSLAALLAVIAFVLWFVVFAGPGSSLAPSG